MLGIISMYHKTQTIVIQDISSSMSRKRERKQTILKHQPITKPQPIVTKLFLVARNFFKRKNVVHHFRFVCDVVSDANDGGQIHR